MPDELFSGLHEIARAVWTLAAPADLETTRISHRRNADHWRVRHAGNSLIARATTREASAMRIIAALNALEGEPFAPAIRAWVRDEGAYVIAMEDFGDRAPTAADTRTMLPAFLEIIKRLHNHQGFREAVDGVGRAEGEDSSLSWAEEEWIRLRALAGDDTTLRLAAKWMDVARESESLSTDARSIMVHGHGDLHNGNWRLTSQGLAIIDWEEIRFWPLASELADFIVFGDVDPGEVVKLYGAPDSYAECARRAAATCALSFYLYWLRTRLDGSDPRPESLARVRIACERLFPI